MKMQAMHLAILFCTLGSFFFLSVILPYISIQLEFPVPKPYHIVFIIKGATHTVRKNIFCKRKVTKNNAKYSVLHIFVLLKYKQNLIIFWVLPALIWLYFWEGEGEGEGSRNYHCFEEYSTRNHWKDVFALNQCQRVKRNAILKYYRIRIRAQIAMTLELWLVFPAPSLRTHFATGRRSCQAKHWKIGIIS